jgi:hypothetical protein
MAARCGISSSQQYIIRFRTPKLHCVDANAAGYQLALHDITGVLSCKVSLRTYQNIVVPPTDTGRTTHSFSVPTMTLQGLV